MNTKDVSTTDIVLASCLKMNGFELKAIEQTGNKGTFVFGDVTEEILSDFDLGKLRVEPVSFNNTIRQLTTSVKRLLTQGNN